MKTSALPFMLSNPKYFQNIKNCIAECAIYLLCVSLYRINRSIRNEIIAINPYGRQFENDILRCIFQKMNFPFCFKFHRSFFKWSNCQHTSIGVFNVWARQRLKFYTKTNFTWILMNRRSFEMVAILCRTRCVKYTKNPGDPPYWPFKR